MRGLALLLFFPLCAVSSTEAENSFRDRRQGIVHFIILFCLYRHGFVYYDCIS